MINIQINGLEEVQRKLADMPNRIEIVAQRAMLKTAQKVKDDEIKHMKSVFDRPTPWTLGSMKVKATKKMEVTMGIVDPSGIYKRANNYLSTQITGLKRKQKAMESSLQSYGIMPKGWYAVPGQGADMDNYGNMNVGQIRQILSWFGAAERWSGSTQNMTEETRAKRRKGTKKKVGFEYFYVNPSATYRKSSKLMPGIYKRFFFGFGKAVKPILMFVPKAKYRKLLKWEEVGRASFDKHWPDEVKAALKIELDRV